MPGVPKSEAMEVEMMAKLMTKRTQKSSEWSDLLPNGRSRPHSDQHRRRVIIAEKLRCRVFLNAKGSSRKNADRARRDVVEIGRSAQELRAGHANISDRSISHRRFNGSSKFYELSIGRQFERFGSITDTEWFAILLPRWNVGQHSDLLCRKRIIEPNWCRMNSSALLQSSMKNQF